MTLAELREFDGPAEWARLTPDVQATIGQAVIAWMAAGTVAEDATAGNSPADRQTARSMSIEACDGLEDAIEQACPALAWTTD